VAEAGFVVRGRVQGVGYRWWARSLGLRLRLEGTVRNRPDGAVELHARGAAADLETLARELAAGPPLARVDRVERIAFRPDEIERGGFVAAR
jgi:acylphosphatase